MRISDCASDVCASDLVADAARAAKVDDVALVCLLDYQIQQVQGDPSPAHTLAERYGTSPEALRKRICRGRRRLRHVVKTDPRFAALSDRQAVVSGKGVLVRVSIGGLRIN